MEDAPTASIAFLTDIARTPLLSAADELRLARRVERGDLVAKDRMVEANLRLVVHVAKRYQRERARPDAARPRPGGHARPAARGGEVRPPPRLPLLHLRRDLDPPVDRAGDHREGPRDPAPDPHRAAAAAARPRGAPARAPSSGATRRPAELAGGGRVAARGGAAARELRRPTLSLHEPVGDGDGIELGDLLVAGRRRRARGARRERRARRRGARGARPCSTRASATSSRPATGSTATPRRSPRPRAGSACARATCGGSRRSRCASCAPRRGPRRSPPELYVLSGYPHLEETYRFGEGVAPVPVSVLGNLRTPSRIHRVANAA